MELRSCILAVKVSDYRPKRNVHRLMSKDIGLYESFQACCENKLAQQVKAMFGNGMAILVPRTGNDQIVLAVHITHMAS